MTEGCEITDTYGYLVQVFLGVLCFLILIYKRHKEKPKRLWRIWTLDNSKQGVSALVAHMLNVILAVTLSGESELDACNWYFVTVLFDTTLGVFICFIILSLFEKIFDRYNLVVSFSPILLFIFVQTSQVNRFYVSMMEFVINHNIYYFFIKLKKFKTGNYFKVIVPNENERGRNKRKNKTGEQLDQSNAHLIKPQVNISYLVWLYQLLIWNFIVILSKLFLYGIQSSISNYLQPFINWMFSWLESQKNLKLLFVMILIPTIMNSIQDNFLKKSEFSSMEKEYVACQIYENEESNEDSSVRRTSPDLQLASSSAMPKSNSSPYNSKDLPL